MFHILYDFLLTTEYSRFVRAEVSFLVRSVLDPSPGRDIVLVERWVLSGTTSFPGLFPQKIVEPLPNLVNEVDR